MISRSLQSSCGPFLPVPHFFFQSVSPLNQAQSGEEQIDARKHRPPNHLRIVSPRNQKSGVEIKIVTDQALPSSF